MTTSIGPSLDSLESVFSDSTRKLIRLINVEWNKVLKLRNALVDKENELFAAKENMARLKEIKIQNENYLKSAEKRLDDLKLSNADLKRKINKREKEKQKIIKNGNKQEEFMRQKIVHYNEKWNTMYETSHTKNPKMLEKIRKITEVRKLSEKLRILIEEEKKYEKELFRIISKRNIFAGGDKVYPFKNLVINIAKIYLETKSIYAECEKVSREIVDAENRIMSKHQILSHDKMSSLKKSTKVAQNFEQSATKEIVSLKQNTEYSDVEMHEYEDTERELAMNISFESNINVKRGNSEKCIKNFTNDLFGVSENANQNSLSNIGNESNILEVEDNDYSTKAPKVLPNEPKARKWMERLKIFVPKFRIDSEENSIKEGKNSTESVGLKNAQIEEKSNTNIAARNLQDAQWNARTKNTENLGKTVSMNAPPQPMPPSKKKVTFDDTILEVPRNMTLQQVSFQNKSKYFTNRDENLESMDWDKELACEKKEAVKPSIQDNVKSNNLEDGNIFQKETKEIRYDQKQNVSTFSEPMDIDENKRKVESSVQKIREREAIEVIEENVIMDNSLLQINRNRKTIQCNDTSVYSSNLNKNETIGKNKNANMSYSMLEKIDKKESKPSSEYKETPILNKKETINKYQNKNLEDSLFQKTLEEKTKPSAERKETLMNQNVINEYQKKKTSSNEIQREMPVQHQIDNNKMPNPVNADPVFDNVTIVASKQHESHNLPSKNILQTSDVSKSDPEKNIEAVTPKKINVPENLQYDQKTALQAVSNISKETSQFVPASRFLHTPAEISINKIAQQTAPANKISNSPVKPSISNKSLQSVPTNRMSHSSLQSSISNKSFQSVPTSRMSHSPVEPTVSKKSSQSDPTNKISHSPIDPSSKNSQPDFKIPSGSAPKSPSLSGSNLKTPSTKHLEISGEPHVDMGSSSFVQFKADSPSPGFAFTTRLMYPADAASNKNDPSETMPKDPQSSIFAQMAFFNPTSPRNFVFGDTQSPDDEKSKFLADYEDYLTDSPPVIKGTEKSMFAFADDSPETEDKNDFFPLFASGNGDAGRDTGNHGTAFTFNFGGNSQAQSPGENKDFKLLF